MGASGTGKSLIISHCASILARRKKKIFVCFFNKTLCCKFEELCDTSFGNIQINNYHKFMFLYISVNYKTQLSAFKDAEYNGDGDKDGYRFISGMKRGIYDYIFVDEMQDMTKILFLILLIY